MDKTHDFMLNGKLKHDNKKKTKAIITNYDDNIYHEFEEKVVNLKGQEHIDYLLDNAFVVHNENLSYTEKQETLQTPRFTTFVQEKDRDDRVFLNARDAFVYKKFDYERINHLKEKLNSIQGKENKVIPEQVFIELEIELKKLRKTFQDLNYNLTRKLLKKIGKPKFFRNIYLIISITKKESLDIPKDIEIEIYRMFEKIQEPFERHKGNRKNFLSYEYTLYKFFEILNLNEYLGYCRLLDSDKKIYDNDIIWEKICNELGPPFEFKLTKK